MISALRWMAVFLAVLLGVESATRLDDRIRFGTPFLNEAVSLADLFVSDSFGPHARPATWFRHFKIDSLGFRGPDRSRAELATRPVIVTAGASETFGLYESADHEWPRQLEDSLLKSCDSLPSPVVLNSAFAGMTLPVVSSDLAHRVKAFAPAVIVYYPTPIQYLYDLPPRAPEVVAGAVGSSLPSARMRAWPRVRDAIKASTPEPILHLAREWSTKRARDASVPYDSLPVDRLALYEKDLRALIGIIRSIGATPVLVVHAHRFGRSAADRDSEAERRSLAAWVRFYPRASGQQLLAFDSRAAERTTAVARDSGVVVVDPRGQLASRPADEVFADFSHFTDAGASVVAAQIAGAVAPLLSCGGGAVGTGRGRESEAGASAAPRP